MKSHAALLCLIALCATCAILPAHAGADSLTGPPTSQPLDPFEHAIAPRQWSFPRDHGRHASFRIEWWYFTGNLADPQNHRWGYELTFFRAFPPPRAMPTTDSGTPATPREIYFAHAAITDQNGKRFECRQILRLALLNLAGASDDKMDVHIGNWSVLMTDPTIALKATDGSDDNLLAIDLTCTPQRPLVFEAPGGLSHKADEPGAASYYYSMTRLATAGTLSLGKTAAAVTGLSWMDHEFSSGSLGAHQFGWDWISLQLLDGRDLMVYQMRDARGPQFNVVMGTLVGADGSPTYLTKSQIHLESSDLWQSPVTGAHYPLKWHMEIPGVPALDVHPILDDQEMVTSKSSGENYYEGASEAHDSSGKLIGRGYLEMTGYQRPLPPGW